MSRTERERPRRSSGALDDKGMELSAVFVVIRVPGEWILQGRASLP